MEMEVRQQGPRMNPIQPLVRFLAFFSLRICIKRVHIEWHDVCGRVWSIRWLSCWSYCWTLAVFATFNFGWAKNTKFVHTAKGGDWFLYAWVYKLFVLGPFKETQDCSLEVVQPNSDVWYGKFTCGQYSNLENFPRNICSHQAFLAQIVNFADNVEGEIERGIPKHPLYVHLAAALYRWITSQQFPRSLAPMPGINEDESWKAKIDTWTAAVVTQGSMLLQVSF